MRRSERGFTLVEIMIVVAIIALLAAIAIPNVLRGRTTANESAAIGNTRALISSLEMVRSVNNEYPALALWEDTMYDNVAACTIGNAPEPDFGPPSFCGVMSAATPLNVQGYNYQYAGVAAPSGTYTLFLTPVTNGTTGTRAFFANQTGLTRHCPCATGAVCGATVGNGPTWSTIDQAADGNTALAGIQTCT